MMAGEQNNVLEFRVSTLEKVVGEIGQSVKSIDGSLQALTRLEARHAETRDSLSRAFTAIQRLEDEDLKDHENRLRAVEADMPTFRLIRNWVIAGVIGIVALVGIAVVGVVVSAAPSKTQATHYQEDVRGR